MDPDPVQFQSSLVQFRFRLVVLNGFDAALLSVSLSLCVSVYTVPAPSHSHDGDGDGDGAGDGWWQCFIRQYCDIMREWLSSFPPLLLTSHLHHIRITSHSIRGILPPRGIVGGWWWQGAGRTDRQLDSLSSLSILSLSMERGGERERELRGERKSDLAMGVEWNGVDWTGLTWIGSVVGRGDSYRNALLVLRQVLIERQPCTA